MDGVEEVWWARGDLNPGPPPCEGGVLTRLDDGPSSMVVDSGSPFIRKSVWLCYFLGSFFSSSMRFRSASGSVMSLRSNFSCSIFTTFGVRNSGSFGPR